MLCVSKHGLLKDRFIVNANIRPLFTGLSCNNDVYTRSNK
jgi:hypothetical protein